MQLLEMLVTHLGPTWQLLRVLSPPPWFGEGTALGGSPHLPPVLEEKAALGSRATAAEPLAATQLKLEAMA